MTAAPEDRKSGVEANWQEHRREQLRRWAALPLREQLAAVEELGELARRLFRGLIEESCRLFVVHVLNRSAPSGAAPSA